MNKVLTNWIGLAGAYGISLADFTGVVTGIPSWVGVASALAGVGLTFALTFLRLAEARDKMAEARAKELDNRIKAFQLQLDERRNDTDD